MALKDIIELEFADNPSRLLKELGLQTKLFKKIKENILTRLMARPELEIIVLEFRRDGMYFGEIKYGNTEHYQQTQAERGHSARITRRRDQSRLAESEISGDDGDSNGEDNESGWSLESLLRRQLGKK